MLRVKICGITNIEDALAALQYGADAMGFVFYRESPRYIPPEEAARIIRALPPFAATVGVFVDESPHEVERIMSLAGLDMAQLHGNEPPEHCGTERKTIKAIRVRDLCNLNPMKDYKVSAYLLDAYAPSIMGGTGQVFNWDIAVEAKRFGRIILAGGLTPENVSRAVEHVRPYAVDVSSGVEAARGRKDHEKLRLFIQNAKGVKPLQ